MSQQFTQGIKPFDNSAQLDAYKRVTLSAAVLAYAGAGEAGLGTLEARTETTDTSGSVKLWNHAGTRFMIANGAISANADVYAAASGKVGATGTVKIGRNVGDAATADGDLIEVLTDATLQTTSGSALVAASTALTNSVTETILGTHSFAANELKAGDVIRVRAQGIATATNSTDTLTFKLKLGATVIVTTGAVDVANNDIGYIDFDIVIRTAGAAGTMVGTGAVALGVEGTVTAKPAKLASAAVDTTAALDLTVTGTWSVANAGNSCRLDVLNVRRIAA